ncbi:PREDICTED: thioredoxin domain-containing protein 15 [Trachymyrmex cornetzi]|uniref:thioredoxin domain-containing protein 15 n=1 Tax=Trachymyrmex cornetzi TaxID=471704 RepID=UPI00084EE957|nr:PREDICTED: thioredoxin domain-containing protein 15 [Trachymyrmex cornetzi]XP_018376274.1 PREDICTED: thioredoxin domain-containing protein 15 [Trachymyrmex cornetzi]XP_018376275.1 PREDICTED: thioredoxin domain-containing protein 15 [Trachymyrmex cornetzi]
MNLLRISFIGFLIPTLILISVISSEEVVEELAAQTGSEDSSFNQEENNEIHTNEKNESVEINTDVTVNVTDTVSTNTTKVNCSSDKIYGPVEIVNATRLMELLMLEPGPSNRSRNDKDGKQLPGTCVLVLFYARWCVFSSQAAPHFNAIPRSFPHIKAVAIDAIKHQSFNAQYGIVGVPTLMLVHNGKPVAKFNDTIYTLESFAKFVSHLTNLQPNGSLYVTSADFMGPVSSTPSNEMDYCLVLSWIFIVACVLYFTSRSRWWQQFVELIQNTWLESNAEHEHVD